MNNITPEMIVENWSKVVGQHSPQEKLSVRTMGKHRKLINLLPPNHRGNIWNRRHGGWISRVPVISESAMRVIDGAIKACK